MEKMQGVEPSNDVALSEEYKNKGNDAFKNQNYA
jgi:hypothetical protein